MSEKSVEKSRLWTLIVYPESAPGNWREILDESHVKWVESPLHDKDTNPDGEIKKAHWHILLEYDGPTTRRNVESMTKLLNGPEIKICRSAKGIVRYMIHMDNPEKYQYERADIVGHNGADVDSYFEISKSNKLYLMKEMCKFIYDNQITNFADFLMICIESNDDWFDVAINSNTLALNKMIDGMYQKERYGDSHNALTSVEEQKENDND